MTGTVLAALAASAVAGAGAPVMVAMLAGAMAGVATGAVAEGAVAEGVVSRPGAKVRTAVEAVGALPGSGVASMTATALAA